MTPRPLADAIWFSKCSPTEKLVLLCIGSHAKPGGGGAYPGIRRVAKLTGTAKSTVEKCIATLVGRGYISIVRHGSQVAANEYQIHIGVLMENEIYAPELRLGVSLLPGQGVSSSPGQGVPGGVPIRETGVSRSEPKGVPTTGTEQSTNKTTEHINGEKLWAHGKQRLKRAIDAGIWETWIQPLTATLEGSNFVLLLPSEDFETAVQRQPLYEVLDAASVDTGIQFESIILRSKEASITQSTEKPSVPLLRPTPRWKRSA
jgi:Helix-turn-helix domain